MSTSTLLGDFENINTTTTIYTQGAGNATTSGWTFSTNTGVAFIPSTSYSYWKPPCGRAYVGHLTTSTTSTAPFISTTLSGLSSSYAYNVRFCMASPIAAYSGGFLPLSLTVTISGSGWTTTTIWNTLPTADTVFVRATSAKFTPPSGVTTATLKFSVAHDSSHTNTAIFIDNVTLETDTSGTGLTSLLDEYLPNLTQMSVSAIVPYGSFDEIGVITSTNNDISAMYGPWMFNKMTGVAQWSGTCSFNSSSQYCYFKPPTGQYMGLLANPTSGTSGATLTPWFATVLYGLSSTNNYNVRICVASCVSQTLPSSFTVTATCGTTSTVIINQLPGNDGVFVRLTSSNFTIPTGASYCRLTFSTSRADLTAVKSILVDSVELLIDQSLSAGIEEYLPGLIPISVSAVLPYGSFQEIGQAAAQNFDMSANGLFGPWMFSKMTGVVSYNTTCSFNSSIVYSYFRPPAGQYAIVMANPATGTTGAATSNWFATILGGLSSSNVYQIRFYAALCQSQTAPSTFTVTVSYNAGGNSTTVFSTVPPDTVFVRCTSSTFTVPSGITSVRVTFATSRPDLSAKQSVLVSRVELRINESLTSGVDEYIPNITPITATGTVPLGSFNEIALVNTNYDLSLRFGPWYFNKMAGTVQYNAGCAFNSSVVWNYFRPVTSIYSGVLAHPPSTTAGYQLSTWFATILSGLSSSYSYNIRFMMALAQGQTNPDSITVTVSSGTAYSVQVYNSLPSTDCTWMRYTTSSFTPSSGITSVRVTFTSTRTDTASSHSVLIRDVQIIVNASGSGLGSSTDDYFPNAIPVPSTSTPSLIPFGSFENVGSTSTSLVTRQKQWYFGAQTGVVTTLPNATYNTGNAAVGASVAGLFMNSSTSLVWMYTILAGLDSTHTYQVTFSMSQVLSYANFDRISLQVSYGQDWSGEIFAQDINAGSLGYTWTTVTSSTFAPPSGLTQLRLTFYVQRTSNSGAMGCLIDAVSIRDLSASTDSITTTLVQDFELITNSSTFTSGSTTTTNGVTFNQGCGVAKLSGVTTYTYSIPITTPTSFSSYVAFMQTSATFTAPILATQLSGLSSSYKYNIRFYMCSPLSGFSGGFMPQYLSVKLQGPGWTTTQIANTLPMGDSAWMRCTTSAFSPPSGVTTANLVFTAGHVTGKTNTGIFIDYITLETDTSNVGRAAGLDEYVPGLPSITANSVIPGGSFNSFVAGDNNNTAATYENWTFGVNTGIINLTGSATTYNMWQSPSGQWSGLIYLLAGGSQLSTSVITRMTGLSNTTTYNLQFAIASCMSATANLALPDTFTVTASCGTSWSQTLWNGLPVQHSIFQLATSTAFTPPSSSVKLTFTANRAVTTVINALLFTDVKIMVSGSSASLTEYPSPPNTFSFRGNTNAVEGGYFDQFNSGDNINRQGSCGPWYFAVNTGWIVNNMPSATYSYTFPKNGYSCGGLFMPSGGSVTNTFMATTITGLKTTSAYNIRFSMASCESSGVAIALPETFTVTVMSGNTYSNVVWNTLPQATTGSFMSIFQRVTSSKFTPPNSTVLVYFAVTRSTTTQTNYILIDEVSLIEDTSGVGTASTIVEYVGETQPITGNGTIPGGDFDSLFQNDQNDSSRQLGPWFFNRYTGAVALPNGGSYNYYMAPSGYFCGGGFFPAGGTYTSTTMSTVLSGLSTSNSYQLRFHVAKPYGKLMVDSLFVNVFTADQTTVLTVWQNNGGFGNFDEYFQQYTTSSFTPTQTSVRVVFSIQRSSTTSIQYILIDNVQIIINGNLPSQAEEYLRDCQPVTTNGQYVPYGDFEGLVNSDQTSLGRTLGPWSFSPGTGIVYLPNTTYNPGLAISGNYVAGLFLNSGVGNVEISTYLTGLSPRNTYSLSFAVAGCTNKSTMDNWLVSVCFGSTNYGIWNGVPGDTGYYYASPTNSFSPPAGHTTGRVIWKNSRNSGTVNQQWAILDAVTINITYNVPNAVSLVVANVQPNSIKVSWTVPTSGGLPSSFFVYKAGTYITSLASDATSYTYTGLSDGTTYTLGIAGNNSVGVGTTATVTQATTTTGPQLTGTTATTTAIAANWTLGAGNSATYTVYLAGNAVANVANTVTSYTFANLVPGTSYTVGATDNVNGIEGNMSTRTTSTIPLTVANLSLTPTTATTAFGSWKAPTGGNAITVYRAYINATKFGSDITYPTANVSLTGLVGSSSYIVSVAAVSAGGQGANSSANVSTIPGAPSLGTTVATTTSLTLPWTSGTIGNVPLDTYSVYIGNTLATTGNSTLANWTFSGLTSATNYIIGVSANNFVGTGLRSNVTVGTLPTQVSNIVVVPATTTAFARWSAPSPSTNITVYRVYVNGTKFGADITYPTANVNITSLVGGTYYNLAVAAVTSGGQGANAFSNITTIPTAPTIGNVVLGQTTLTMPWTITGNAVSSYNVYLSNVFVTSLASNTTTYTFSNLTTSTAYRLAVSAYDVSGNSGVSFVTKTTLALAPTIGNLTANATDITMEWSTIAANVAKYKLYRGSNNVGNVAANVSVYDFSGLAATTSYILGVSAVVDSTEGIVQTVTTATTPNPVTALTLTPASSSIYAAWTAPSGNGLSSYMAFVNGSQIGSNITAPASNVTLSGLTGASTYAVSIATVSSGGIGANTFANATTTPAAPTIGTLTNTANSIVMPWTAPVGGNAVIANYTVYKANVIFATVAANVTSYTFSNLAPTTAYILGIAASDSAGRGPVANVSTGTIPATPTIGNIRANATLVLMQWASVGNVSYYNMYLSGNYVANVASTSYTFTGLIDTTPYTMGVSAVISGVEGNIATVTSGTTPIAPVIGTLTTSITTVIMPWTAPATTGNLVIANYAVYKAGSFFATVPSDTTTYTFANLTQGTAYTLGVAALDVNGAGPIASTSTTTLTSAPTMGNVTSNASAISMQWSTIAGASYYNVYLSGNYVANVVSTSYTFSNLSNGTGYSVGVAGVTSGVEGGMVTVSAGTSPGTPVIGSLSAGSSTITMPWSVTGNIISNYSVYKGGIFVTTVSGTSYTYTGLTESTSYTLGVAATDAYGTGPTANVTKSTVSSAPALIGQPTVTVSSIALQWSVSGNASFYMMYLSGNNVANVTGRNTYTFSNLLGSTLYTVGTSSVTDGLESPVSTVSVPTQPGPPILANTSSTTTQFTVNWKAPTGGNVISNYRFYLGPNKQNGDLSAATTSYSMSGLPTASVFPYQISAVNSSGEGSRVQGNVSTLIVAPTVTANAAPSYRAVGIALSANVTGNAGVQGYKVYANGNLIAVLPSGTTTYNLSGLKGNTSYNIVVTAVDDYGTESVAANLTQSTTSRNEVLYALANTAAIVQSNLAVHSVSTKEVLGNTFSSIKTLITANASSDTTIRTLMQTYATTTSTLTTKCSTLSALAKQRKSLLKSMENA